MSNPRTPPAENACTVPGCERPRRTYKLYCASHYARARAGRLDEPIDTRRGPQPTERQCAAAGCERQVKRNGGARGLCAMHYQRTRRAAKL